MTEQIVKPPVEKWFTIHCPECGKRFMRSSFGFHRLSYHIHYLTDHWDGKL